MKRLLVLVALLGACKVNDYCLECQTGDGSGTGGGSDAGSDGSGSDSGTCTPTAGGSEICDGIDNDCDGLVDEGTLPQVGDACTNQMGACAGGKLICAPTFHCSISLAQKCASATDTSCPTGEICKADAASTNSLVCDKQPTPEICDGIDNNCNGTIDENDPGGLFMGMIVSTGAACGDVMAGGTCKHGVYHCEPGGMANDQIQCVGYIGPTPEVCDGLDNDCNGMTDDGITGLGTCGAPEPGCASPPCGTCVLGNKMCVGGTVQCIGAVNPQAESCNGLDDDCDGTPDEDFNLPSNPQNCGACGNVCGSGIPNGGNAVWACSNSTCVIAQCKAGFHDNDGSALNGCEFGPCFTSGPEVCDGEDNDCDGVIDEKAAVEPTNMPPAICATQGECAGTVAVCPCLDTNDSPGCTTGGTCVTSCATPRGWTCNYPATVSTDGNGNIIPETLCDGKDNDCNGTIDDHQAQMAHPDGTTFVPVACADNGLGVCQGTGTFKCGDQATPPQDPNGPAVCVITSPGQSPGTEKCNNLDDDCDGIVDNGASTGSLPIGQEWVNIGGGHQMMKYEVSRPDSTATSAGALSTKTCNTVNIATTSETGTTATINTSAAHGFAVGRVVTISGVSVSGYNGTWQIISVPTTTSFTVTLAAGLGGGTGGTVSTNCVSTCSQAGVLPWTNVTYMQALAACQAIGASLCYESEWHRACSAVGSVTFPAAVSATSTAITVEAEDFSGIAYATDTNGATRSWVEDETAGFSAVGDLQAAPATGTAVTIGNALAQAPRVDYSLSFATNGTYRVYVRMFANTNANETIFTGLGATAPVAPVSTHKLANAQTKAWTWVTATSGTTTFTINGAPTTRVLSVYMGSPGVKIDAILVTTGTTTPTTLAGPGGNWAMQPTPNTYITTACNDHDYNASIPQPDQLLTTGALTQCFAADSVNDHAFDMSGNAKEWVLAHQPGQNPIRGGSFDDTATGISCPLNFTLADDTFFFPNVGFRCCR